MNRGLKVFRDAGEHAIHKEMKQLHEWRVTIPVDPAKIFCGIRSAALKYLMFLQMNSGGLIKGHSCT